MQQLIANFSPWRWLLSRLGGRRFEKSSISLQSTDEAWSNHQASLGVELTALKEESMRFLKSCEEFGSQSLPPIQCSPDQSDNGGYPHISEFDQIRLCAKVRNDCE
jgi:hypothetical protein